MRVTLLLLPALGCMPPIGQHHSGEPDAGVDDADTDAPTDGSAVTPRSCRDALANGVAANGVVSIDPDGEGGAAPYDVYCDMKTAGGGWTLMYSYGFTNYNNFTNSNNAITPRPSWGNANNGTPVSTTMPTSPDTHSAAPFDQWKNYGTEVLITSNVNHWLRCTPGGGSLVTMTTGSITCEIVMVVGTKCTTTVPNSLQTTPSGPKLIISGNNSNNYYYWDGSQSQYWPTHDPCGTNQGNEVAGVTNPGGAIYVR